MNILELLKLQQKDDEIHFRFVMEHLSVYGHESSNMVRVEFNDSLNENYEQ